MPAPKQCHLYYALRLGSCQGRQTAIGKKRFPLIPGCLDVMPGISKDSRRKRLISFVFHGSTGDNRLFLDPKC